MRGLWLRASIKHLASGSAGKKFAAITVHNPPQHSTFEGTRRSDL